MRWLVAVLVSVAIGGAGYLVAWVWGWPALSGARASGSWPATTGHVERSEVVLFGPSGERREPELELLYTYHVDGETYLGDDVHVPLPGWLAWGENPREVGGRYPAGLDVRVHYDPADPARAVLEPGAPQTLYLAVAAGMALVLVGAGGVVASVLSVFRRIGSRSRSRRARRTR